ncbi:ABC-three component system protein [Shewanella algae]|uniref:ABC-three component system protein n=1 Tax=Shewanella algae TaxID=38313 RepID=UPI0031F5871C
MAFDASPSWSGFNYQGKIALHYALLVINSNPVDYDFENISLMLEDTEDFDIYENDILKSIHQVKAYNKSSFSNYSNALLELVIELSKRPHVKGYIHTWKNINNKPLFDSIKDSIKDEIKILLDEYDKENNNNSNIIIAKSRSNNKPKIAAILKKAYTDKSSQEIYEELKSIHDGQNDALLRLFPFKYEDNYFCDLDNINEKIKTELSKALEARTLVVTQEHLDKKLNYFFGVVDKHIIDRHKNKQGEKISISLSEIVQIVISDHEDISNEYLAYKFKELFANEFDEYMQDKDEYNEPADGLRCNLKEARKTLLGMNATELWAYYRNFCPHIYLERQNNTENAIILEMSGVRHALLKILNSIKYEYSLNEQQNSRLIYKKEIPELKYYSPTTITKLDKPKKIEQQILKNPSMNEILYEIGNLIYGGDEIYKINTDTITNTQVPRAEGEDERTKRDDILKTITLTPIINATNELN